MNPFRSLFISLSRMPPMLMLFVILGLAVVVTMYVMGIVNEGQEKLKLIQAANDANLHRTAKVVYATKNIAEGEMIAQEALAEKDVEVGRAPVDAYNSVNAVVGQQAAYGIPADAVVSTHAIRPFNMPIGFNGKIADGMRAVTFGVDTNSGVAGFIAPGNRVDVLAVTGAADTTKAAAVMSDVEVIAVGTTYQKQPGSTTANPAGSVTVTVTPDQATDLVKSVSAAKLYLTLRNDKDRTPITVVDVKTLFPRRIDTSVSLASALPPPDVAIPPPPMGASSSGLGNAPATITPLPPPMHEIEMWSGPKKEVLSVPQG